MELKYFIGGCVFWGIIASALFLLRKNSRLHTITIESVNKRQRVIIFFTCVVVILSCTLPMGISPIWNGEIPQHRNQYEVMAEAILEGHIYIDYGDTDKTLLEMENPYDTEKRNELGVKYHWDHAFYNGHYYMYFGVVPVFLVFLPYRIITGANLTTYHATQIFVVAFIVGIFHLFYSLAKKFFNKLSLGMYLTLSSAVSVMSIWFSIGMPALYCTPITAGLCMEVWSIYFFVDAVWGEMSVKKSIMYAFVGSLFGALAFGCRPPIALANLLVIPMLAEYLRRKKEDSSVDSGQILSLRFTSLVTPIKVNVKMIGQLTFAALPYVVIGILLMLYNYARFDSPFEFGQSYQLTGADLHTLGHRLLSKATFIKVINGLLQNFISYSPIGFEFPYISPSGAFANFPIFLLSFIGIASKNVRIALKKQNFLRVVQALFCMPVIITIIDVIWSPSIIEEYRMDIYWLMGLLCFVIIGFYRAEFTGLSEVRFSCLISIWAFLMIFKCMLFYVRPSASNPTEYYPELLEYIKRILSLGLYGQG